jgi:hypothetical protein
MYHSHLPEVASAFKPLAIGLLAIKISTELAGNLGAITMIASSIYAVGKLGLFIYELYKTFKTKRRNKTKVE